MPKQIRLSDYVDTAEAGRLLGLCSDTVRKYCDNHQHGESPAIEGICLGGRWLISRQAIRDYQKRRRHVGWPKGKPRKKGAKKNDSGATAKGRRKAADETRG